MNLSTLQDHELRVPIQRLRAEMHTEREVSAATLLLAPLATVEDVFEEDAPFVPVEVGGKTRLVARGSIVTIIVDDDGAPGSLSTLGVPYELCAVAVHLRDGSTITGVVALSSTQRRTLDVLNQPARSFAIRENGRVFHVAKAHVTRVEEIA